MYEDNLPHCDVFPKYITVLNGEADFHCDSYTLEVCNYPIRRYGNAKGRQIFRKYERMLTERGFLSEDEREVSTSIVNYHRSPLSDKATLYAYLAAAKRLNMKLTLFVGEDNSRRIYHDGGEEKELFLRLIKP